MVRKIFKWRNNVKHDWWITCLIINDDGIINDDVIIDDDGIINDGIIISYKIKNCNMGLN